VPENVGSFIALLFFVAPGICFELLREQARHARLRSAFRESSVVVLSSVVFSAGAVAALGLVRAIKPSWMPEPVALVRSPGRYATDHLGLVARTLVVEVALACGLAMLVHLLLVRCRPAGAISPEPAWFELVRGGANPRSDALVVHVELHDGSAVTGVLKAYDLDADGALRNLVLHGTGQHRLRTRQASTGKTLEVPKGWAYVVVPAAEIKLGTIAFVDPPAPG
jgi:hypothetical protein